MIGIVARADQTPAVEEFFELFKTPWERYEDGRAYDVVLSTTGDVPEGLRTKLLLLYGSSRQPADSRYGIFPLRHLCGTVVTCEFGALPIYAGLLTFEHGGCASTCLRQEDAAAGLIVRTHAETVIRVGYDLFDETAKLLSTGQPVQHAGIPTLDVHIDLLRSWMLTAGVDFLEIPPSPSGHPFAVCLTHDIDFIGIRYHLFDHSMWGFLYRSSVGSVRNFIRGRLTLGRLLKSWRAALTLPLVFMGWAEDFWEPFEWYLQVEKGLPSTYYLIPFKRRPGERFSGAGSSRRASAYDVMDLRQSVARLRKANCEIGVHGIDAWHDPARGRAEREQIAALSGDAPVGIRMHWLLRDRNTNVALDDAGFSYDSTGGYNETIGYRHGTTQVFRAPNTRALLELPMHIQDGAMFFPDRLDLTEEDAWTCCAALIDRAKALAGVLTVLWHDRSHAPERFWGDFYMRLVHELRSSGAWFGTAAQVTNWFARRREVRFERVHTSSGDRIRLCGSDCVSSPSMTLRVHRAAQSAPTHVDVAWNGATTVHVNGNFGFTNEPPDSPPRDYVSRPECRP